MSSETTSHLTKDFLAKAEVSRLELKEGLKEGILSTLFNNPNEASQAYDHCAIGREDILNHLADALKNERIEPYQATLLMAANARVPFKLKKKYQTWERFLPALIAYHNNSDSFVTKKRVLLNAIMYGGLATYGRLRSAGLLRNHDVPGEPDHVDTEREIIFDQDDKIPHDRKPAHPKKEHTEAAISKQHFLPLIKEAMDSGRMLPEQACIMLAINVHSMERRTGNGARYIDHVMAVAADRSLNHRQRMIALLHDVLENSDWTAQNLRDVGLDDQLVNSIEQLTKRPDEKVYLHFIQRVSTDPDALAVKMADIRHNSLDAKETKPEKMKKYDLALEYLNAVKRRHILPGSSIEEFARSINEYDEQLFKPENKDKGAKGGNSVVFPSQASSPKGGFLSPNGSTWAA